MKFMNVRNRMGKNKDVSQIDKEDILAAKDINIEKNKVLRKNRSKACCYQMEF